MDLFNSLINFFGKVGIVLLLGVGLIVNTLTSNISVSNNTTPTPPAPTHTATTTTKVATTTPSKPKTATTTATNKTTPKKTTPVVTPPAPAVPKTLLPLEDVNAEARKAIVNILCTTHINNRYSSVSGSGVFVDSRGVILTNAHVAQYFLLSNYPNPGDTNCVIRSGSPAQTAYAARLLYLPPVWVDVNAKQIIAQDPMGTGENDYAFLLVTSSLTSTPLPTTFPTLGLTTGEPEENDSVLLAAYPAGFLSGASIQSGLYILSSAAKIGQLYTFDDPHHVDVVSLGGTVVSQSGSSGGAVVELSNARLTGIIATDTEGTTTASRDLNAITLAHINRSLISGGYASLSSFLSQNVVSAADEFNKTVAPAEAAKLEAALKKTF